MWDGAASGLPDACCASDPISNVPPYTPPAERLASPPLRGSRSRPLFPDSLQSANLHQILRKFHLSAAVASASPSMGCILDAGRGATRQEGHPRAPCPARSAIPNILRSLRSRQRKHARGAALPSFGRPHPCGLATPRCCATPRQLCFLCRRVSDSIFSQKPVLRHGSTLQSDFALKIG